jgi:hypothetical protein
VAERRRRVASPPTPRSFVPVTTDQEMQRVVLAVVLREYPVLLTFPAIACELFENPNDLVGGMALARAVRDLHSWGTAAQQWLDLAACTASSRYRPGMPRLLGLLGSQPRIATLSARGEAIDKSGIREGESF